VEDAGDPNAPIPADRQVEPEPEPEPGQSSSITRRFEKLQARVNAGLRP
jgi:hypothetical protein